MIKLLPASGDAETGDADDDDDLAADDEEDTEREAHRVEEDAGDGGTDERAEGEHRSPQS